MNGGLTYRDMEERKAAMERLKRLEIWLEKEAIVFDYLTPAALHTIRIVLEGRI
jgi:hypothetical protein